LPKNNTIALFTVVVIPIPNNLISSRFSFSSFPQFLFLFCLCPFLERPPGKNRKVAVAKKPGLKLPVPVKASPDSRLNQPKHKKRRGEQKRQSVKLKAVGRSPRGQAAATAQMLTKSAKSLRRRSILRAVEGKIQRVGTKIKTEKKPQKSL
jgi:hypothetical protein